MNKDTITQKIISAYRAILTHDSYLFIASANERSMTHKLAEYLQQEFPDWNVDCEYNKNLDSGKTVPVWEAKRAELMQKLENEMTNRRRNLIEKVLDGGISVYPDIIIHHRGTRENLVVIEAKKENFAGNDFDEQKLEAYKNHLGYEFAFKVKFPSNETELANTNVDVCVTEI